MRFLDDLLDRAMLAIVAAAFITMFSFMFANVVLRFAFHTGLPIAEEIARFAFVWATFIGAFLALKRGAHIGITGVRPRIPQRWHPAFDAFVVTIQLAVTLIVLVGAVRVLIANVGGQAPVSGAPIVIAFAALVVGAILLALVFAGRLVVLLVRKGRRP